MKIVKKTIASVLTVALLSGCGTQPQVSNPDVSSTPPVQTEDAGSKEVYPLQGERKLTYWVGVTSANTATNNDDVPFWQELQKRTGIDIEFMHPVSGQESEAFNLMLAAGDYPDIIESKLVETGTLYNKGVIIDLTDVMPQYSPNYYNYLQANPEILRQVKSDDGKLMLYPLIREAAISQTTTGPIVRKDWLDKLNLAEPETIEEWEIMLTAFKEQLNIPIPLGTRASTTTTNMIASAWNIYLGFYHDDGTVKYGYTEAAFKDYITTMARWYQNGLLDKNFASADKKTQDANFLAGKQGATFGAVGGNLGVWMTGAKANGDNEFNLVGLKLPVLNKGDVPQYYDITQFEYSNGNPWAMVSSQCKDIEAAARLLDYGYTEEGGKLYNFGIEGISYTIVDNAIIPLTEEEVQAKYNMNITDFKKSYSRSTDSGPFVLTPYLMQFSQTEEQMAALENWSHNENKEHKMPPIVLSADASMEFSSIMADIKTYNEEMIVKFIMGVESLDNLDKYQSTIMGMNIERAIEIQQEALDRYFAR